MNIMGLSIQDYLKKINSSLSAADCISLLITMLFLGSFLIYLKMEHAKTSIPLSYTVGTSTDSIAHGEGRPSDSQDSRPFGSSKGKTYTFSWCQGANRILVKNRVYFGSEEEAKQSGRTLSKLCSKK
jgi:hypothetical protein